MRGKPVWKAASGRGIGITPAGAGKTTIIITVYTLIRDHPRRCGENREQKVFEAKTPGSPPQVRGKLPDRYGGSRRTGITPAGAGKTLVAAGKRTLDVDHPRRCGENNIQRRDDTNELGSPPQVRGKLRSRTPTIFRPRITPAYAGKTPCRTFLSAHHRDHPRVCGENMSTVTCSGLIRGSPPRMRGKPRVRANQEALCRITPAYAGKTSESPSAGRRCRDHPRVCGENISEPNHIYKVPGSPPRMRGKPVNSPPPCAPRRITPAYAGKTSALAFFNLKIQDHPRVCGENFFVTEA